MSDNLLAEIPLEGETVEQVLDSVEKELQESKEKSEDKPAESQTEKQIEKLELPDEEKLAATKRNSAFEEMRVARAEAERKAQELESRLSALEKGDSTEKSEFVKSLVGENEDVEKNWAKEKQGLKEEVKQEIIQEQANAEKKAKEEKERWVKWTNDRLSEVEKEFKVDFKTDESTKNALSKIMLDYSPTDEHGNLDYRKGMKLLLEKKEIETLKETQKTQVKKNIADATVSKETTVKQNKDFVTSNDIRGKDWRSWIN